MVEGVRQLMEAVYLDLMVAWDDCVSEVEDDAVVILPSLDVPNEVEVDEIIMDVELHEEVGLKVTNDDEEFHLVHYLKDVNRENFHLVQKHFPLMILTKSLSLLS